MSATTLVLPPIALYVHYPWCVRKCPYCDFNSHTATDSIPQQRYVDALLAELAVHLSAAASRPFLSVFFGGGTPSLMNPDFVGAILRAAFAPDERVGAEISLEANPGTLDATNFSGFRKAGVNRLSIGVQSFRADALRVIGRIHSAQQAIEAFQHARRLGFRNINIDLMFGLPGDTAADMLADLKQALHLEPEHISWYSFTIEPNTAFAAHPPALPSEDEVADALEEGQQLLSEHGYGQYETSAYARAGWQCMHNRNYWEYGDYLGIGAGAHSKLTDISNETILRQVNARHPARYLEQASAGETHAVSPSSRPFEFMLNALRLTQGFPPALFIQRTGLPLECIHEPLDVARRRQLLQMDECWVRPTPLGARFLNDLQGLFLA